MVEVDELVIATFNMEEDAEEDTLEISAVVITPLRITIREWNIAENIKALISGRIVLTIGTIRTMRHHSAA